MGSRMPLKLVIVGGVAGGMSAATRARRLDELATADYKGLRVKMKNIRFLPNATTKPIQHLEHDICLINLTIIIAVHLSVYTL